MVSVKVTKLFLGQVLNDLRGPVQAKQGGHVADGSVKGFFELGTIGHFERFFILQFRGKYGFDSPQ